LFFRRLSSHFSFFHFGERCHNFNE
jgi:hypothetical protein